MIQDSGDRTAFETGAVRDMHEGKGRCDLMPLEVVAALVTDDAITNLAFFQDTGKTEYLYDSLESFAGEFGGIHQMLLEVAKHFEEGALKYGEGNWQKGIPVHSYMDSAVRHWLKYRSGENDERHDRAFCWNVICAIWTVVNKPELNDFSAHPSSVREE